MADKSSDKIEVRAQVLHRWGVRVAKVLAFWIAVMGVAIGVGALRDHAPWVGNLVSQFTLAGAALAGFFIHAHYRKRDWTGPMARLGETYKNVRDCVAPIDELKKVGGQLQPISAMFEELFLDLRNQKAEVSKLHEELRQRVAARTENLERRIGSLKRQSTTDKLTGLQNRRRLDEALPELIDRCRVEGQDLAVLMIDVDYFKQLNDLKGHAAGDDFLRQVGQLIRSSIREEDEAFRIGGDEFVIVQPDITMGNAHATAGRLTSMASALAKTFKVPLSPQLSIGIATLTSTPEGTAAGLLVEADKRLYEIKTARPVKSRAC
jgi:diguanylate cyclase (GGDEF)-like protein